MHSGMQTRHMTARTSARSSQWVMSQAAQDGVLLFFRICISGCGWGGGGDTNAWVLYHQELQTNLCKRPTASCRDTFTHTCTGTCTGTCTLFYVPSFSVESEEDTNTKERGNGADTKPGLTGAERRGRAGGGPNKTQHSCRLVLRGRSWKEIKSPPLRTSD